MPFIKQLSITAGQVQPFPYNIPAVQFAKNIAVNSGVTIFAGDNGTGKSTLLETLALQLDLPLIGGHIGSHGGFAAARTLQPYIDITWQRQTKNGFFFRAEDFSDFVHAADKSQQSIEASLADLKGNVADTVITAMAENMNTALREMRKNYGENMQAFSHGEAYLQILQSRIGRKGIYLLDEPEAALSPLRQLSLMSFIMDAVKTNHTQFILATHSPILMGIPGALLYEIKENSMETVSYKETEHYRITKTFLDNPDHYLRHL
jgi:predicted ATPase